MKKETVKENLNGNANKIPPIVRLSFKKNEMIVREGTYNNAVWIVVKGLVGVFFQKDDVEVTLFNLGAGEMMGVDLFFNQGLEAVVFSARAMEDTVLEFWHIKRIEFEVKKMPSFFRQVAFQNLRRLVRTRMLCRHLKKTKTSNGTEGLAQKREVWATQQRKHYRKDTDLPCTYRPVNTSERLRLPAMIKNLSREGAGVQTGGEALLNFSHDIGEEFILEITLPGENLINFKAKIVNARKNPQGLYLGVFITDISYNNLKKLGFFLM